ncbi:choloylglycine hydrolase family protein [Gibbsiella dentisursi]|uniref:Choloylglycine hydrolase family protein n=1 Tax=Gibbsiella dentisursi TaxID=796890 RepID=A0ABP7LA92_9GAMM
MCTGLSLMCKDSTFLTGRAMMFGADSKFEGVFNPIGKKFTSLTFSGLCWDSKYASIGIFLSGTLDFIIDGMNERGLVCGGFYFSDFSQYAETITPGKSVGPLEICQLLLSSCADIDDVVNFITNNEIDVHNIPFLNIPLHWPVFDAAGNAVVIESVGGKLIIKDNPVGTCTNSPNFEWHLENLSNYTHLQATNWPEKIFNDKFTAKVSWPGNGLSGMPGDFSSPSRFVRAAYLSNLVSKPESYEDGVNTIFHLLSTSDVVGGVEIGGEDNKSLEITNFSSCCDTNNLNYYYCTYGDRTLRRVSLSSLLEYKETLRFPLPESQTVIDVTPTAG